MLLAEVVGDVDGDDGDVNGGVELLELAARLGAVLADVALREIKVRAKIGELDRGGVCGVTALTPAKMVLAARWSETE